MGLTPIDVIQQSGSHHFQRGRAAGPDFESTRALMQEPDLMLADEPTSSLDPKTSVEIMELMCDYFTVGTMMNAADQHLPARVHLVAHAVGVQGHHVHGRELLVVQREREPDQQADQGEEGHADKPEPGLAHPATRTVVVAPQMARLRKKSVRLIVTIAVRTARPTATPTPAGPPLAR